jgi:glucosamine-6-phosphate deaminase
VKWEVLADVAELADGAAARLLAAVDSNPRIVLGLPTGNTPLELYRRAVAACRVDRHCFAGATTFNLDEYVGLPPGHPGSYRAYMEQNFLGHVDIDPRRTHVPDGTASRVLEEEPNLSVDEALARECRRYEEAIRAAGGLDLTFLGLGVNGHIAFNEPGAGFETRTRVVELAPSTRRANARHFVGGEVPRRAITMGIATILESRRIVLLASGDAKAAAVARLRAGEVSEGLPASALHAHPDVTVLVDRAAAEMVGATGDAVRREVPRRRGPGGAPLAPFGRGTASPR